MTKWALRYKIMKYKYKVIKLTFKTMRSWYKIMRLRYKIIKSRFKVIGLTIQNNEIKDTKELDPFLPLRSKLQIYGKEWLILIAILVILGALTYFRSTFSNFGNGITILGSEIMLKICHPKNLIIWTIFQISYNISKFYCSNDSIVFYIK